MKKEYIILVVIIAALSVYLFSRSTDQSNYDLPELEKIKKTQITKIQINKKDLNLSFSKEDDKWYINNEKYLADMSLVNSMLDTISDLKVSALVAQKGDLNRYELSEEKRIKVIARSNSGILREFNIGKTAPSLNHTFITLKDNKNVFHGQENFKSNFDKSLDDFRDKTIFSFKEEDIKNLKLIKENKEIELVLEEQKVVKKDSEDKESKSVFLWKAKNGLDFDHNFATSIVSNLTSLKCQSYLDDKEKNKLAGQNFLLKILINEKISLTVFEKKENYPALSSNCKYAFLLAQKKGENFISDIDKILGIEKPKDEETKKE